MKILEIGCGIGVLTWLLSKKITQGYIEAVDFSQKSVDYATTNNRQPNVMFTCSDILQYEPQQTPFGYILAFDVLEHIPTEQHAALFEKINRWMHPGSKFFINLPNPGYILYDRINNPDELQEIDQPVYFHSLAENLRKHDLHITSMETYSIWVKNDYQFYIVEKNIPFEANKLKLSLFDKAVNRLTMAYRKIRYNYPQ
ncbi:MAG: methyltransferase domain-containing protein [Bacteroidales bacterium]|nr:methyltransferase domain-containing protein [Bacteroidales bacterium]